MLREVGAFLIFMVRTHRSFIRSFFEAGSSSLAHELVWSHLLKIFSKSVPIVCVSGFVMGAIFVMQFQLMLRQFDGDLLLGGLNTSALIREVGPLIISFVLSARIGAFTAAELGAMRVTLQFDAARAMATNPLAFFIAPRFIAIVVSSWILQLLGTAWGIVGSLVFARVFLGVAPLLYLQSVPAFLSSGSYVGACLRSFVFSIVIAVVCTYKGYSTGPSTKSLGRAVTQTAVYTNLFILLSNAGISFFVELIS